MAASQARAREIEQRAYDHARKIEADAALRVQQQQQPPPPTEGEAEGEAEDLLVQALQLLLPVPLQNLLLRAGAEPGAGARAVADNVSLTF